MTIKADLLFLCSVMLVLSPSWHHHDERAQKLHQHEDARASRQSSRNMCSRLLALCRAWEARLQPYCGLVCACQSASAPQLGGGSAVSASAETRRRLVELGFENRRTGSRRSCRDGGSVGQQGLLPAVRPVQPARLHSLCVAA